MRADVRILTHQRARPRAAVAPRLGGRTGLAIFTGGLLFALLAVVVFSITTTGDYQPTGPVGGDNAGPALQALVHGRIDGYLDLQPIIGLPSILLRLPVLALATAFGAGSLLGYQLGALVCVLPLALCGGWFVSEPGLSTQQRLLRLAAVLLVIQSPIVHSALTAGHPEGMLSTVLATLAVLAAMGERAGWAALLLGLAISTKETGVIALVPVMLALPGRRLKVAAIAGVVVLLLCVTGWVADPDALLRSLQGEGSTRYLLPFSLLWPVSSPLHIGAQLSVARVMPFGLTRTPATLLTVASAMPPAILWYVRARRRGATPQPLVMLVLFGLLRCVLDSTHEAYYPVTFLIPLATWEACQDQIPIRTLLLNGAVLVMFSAVGKVSPAILYVVSTSAATLLTIYLARLAMVTNRRASAVSLTRPWRLATVTTGREN